MSHGRSGKLVASLQTRPSAQSSGSLQSKPHVHVPPLNSNATTTVTQSKQGGKLWRENDLILDHSTNVAAPAVTVPTNPSDPRQWSWDSILHSSKQHGTPSHPYQPINNNNTDTGVPPTIYRPSFEAPATRNGLPLGRAISPIPANDPRVLSLAANQAHQRHSSIASTSSAAPFTSQSSTHHRTQTTTTTTITESTTSVTQVPMPFPFSPNQRPRAVGDSGAMLSYGSEDGPSVYTTALLPALRTSERDELKQLGEALEFFVAKLDTQRMAHLRLDDRDAVEKLMDLLKEEQGVYDLFFDEIIRQVTIQCRERGELLGKIREYYANLLLRVPLHLYSIQSELSSQQKLNATLQESHRTMREQLFAIKVELGAYTHRFKEAAHEVEMYKDMLSRAEHEKDRARAMFTQFKEEWDHQRRELEEQLALLREEREDYLSTAAATATALQKSKNPNLLVHSLLEDEDSDEERINARLAFLKDMAADGEETELLSATVLQIERDIQQSKSGHRKNGATKRSSNEKSTNAATDDRLGAVSSTGALHPQGSSLPSHVTSETLLNQSILPSMPQAPTSGPSTTKSTSGSFDATATDSMRQARELQSSALAAAALAKANQPPPVRTSASHHHHHHQHHGLSSLPDFMSSEQIDALIPEHLRRPSVLLGHARKGAQLTPAQVALQAERRELRKLRKELQASRAMQEARESAQEILMHAHQRDAAADATDTDARHASNFVDTATAAAASDAPTETATRNDHFVRRLMDSLPTLTRDDIDSVLRDPIESRHLPLLLDFLTRVEEYPFNQSELLLMRVRMPDKPQWVQALRAELERRGQYQTLELLFSEANEHKAGLMRKLEEKDAANDPNDMVEESSSSSSSSSSETEIETGADRDTLVRDDLSTSASSVALLSGSPSARALDLVMGPPSDEFQVSSSNPSSSRHASLRKRADGEDDAGSEHGGATKLRKKSRREDRRKQRKMTGDTATATEDEAQSPSQPSPHASSVTIENSERRATGTKAPPSTSTSTARTKHHRRNSSLAPNSTTRRDSSATSVPSAPSTPKLGPAAPSRQKRVSHEEEHSPSSASASASTRRASLRKESPAMSRIKKDRSGSIDASSHDSSKKRVSGARRKDSSPARGTISAVTSSRPTTASTLSGELIAAEQSAAATAARIRKDLEEGARARANRARGAQVEVASRRASMVKRHESESESASENENKNEKATYGDDSSPSATKHAIDADQLTPRSDANSSSTTATATMPAAPVATTKSDMPRRATLPAVVDAATESFKSPPVRPNTIMETTSGSKATTLAHHHHHHPSTHMSKMHHRHHSRAESSVSVDSSAAHEHHSQLGQDAHPLLTLSQEHARAMNDPRAADELHYHSQQHHQQQHDDATHADAPLYSPSLSDFDTPSGAASSFGDGVMYPPPSSSYMSGHNRTVPPTTTPHAHAHAYMRTSSTYDPHRPLSFYEASQVVPVSKILVPPPPLRKGHVETPRERELQLVIGDLIAQNELLHAQRQALAQLHGVRDTGTSALPPMLGNFEVHSREANELIRKATTATSTTTTTTTTTTSTTAGGSGASDLQQTTLKQNALLAKVNEYLQAYRAAKKAAAPMPDVTPAQATTTTTTSANNGNHVILPTSTSSSSSENILDPSVQSTTMTRHVMSGEKDLLVNSRFLSLLKATGSGSGASTARLSKEDERKENPSGSLTSRTSSRSSHTIVPGTSHVTFQSFSVAWSTKWIRTIYDAKLARDEICRKEGVPLQRFPEFLIEVQRKQFGLDSLTQRKTWDILQSLCRYRHSSREIAIFIEFLEESRPLDELILFLRTRAVVLASTVGVRWPGHLLDRGTKSCEEYISLCRVRDVIATIFNTAPEMQDEIYRDIVHMSVTWNQLPDPISKARWDTLLPGRSMQVDERCVTMTAFLERCLNQFRSIELQLRHQQWAEDLFNSAIQTTTVTAAGSGPAPSPPVEPRMDFSSFSQIFSLAEPRYTPREVAQLYSNVTRNVGVKSLSKSVFKKLIHQLMNEGVMFPLLKHAGYEQATLVRMIIRHWNNFKSFFDYLLQQLTHSERSHDVTTANNLRQIRFTLEKEIARVASGQQADDDESEDAAAGRSMSNVTRRLVATYRGMLNVIGSHQSAFMMTTTETPIEMLHTELKTMQHVILQRHRLHDRNESANRTQLEGWFWCMELNANDLIAYLFLAFFFSFVDLVSTLGSKVSPISRATLSCNHPNLMSLCRIPIPINIIIFLNRHQSTEQTMETRSRTLRDKHPTGQLQITKHRDTFKQI